MKDSFNGFRELFSRTDVVSVLLNKYSNTYVAQENTFRNCSPELFFESSTLEFLFACNELQNGEMSIQDNSNFLNIHEKKKAERAESGMYSAFSNMYETFNNQTFSNSLTRAIPTYTSVPNGEIKTPKGSNVTGVTKCVTDFTSAEKTSWNQHYDSVYPNATRGGTTTGKYNCYSYAWYNRSINNAYWLNNFSAYTRDGSYIRYTGTPYSGIIVDYGNAGHSAVCTGQFHAGGEPYVKSKWGYYGFYQHVLGYCPYAMSGLTPTYTYYKANY